MPSPTFVVAFPFRWMNSKFTSIFSLARRGGRDFCHLEENTALVCWFGWTRRPSNYWSSAGISRTTVATLRMAMGMFAQNSSKAFSPAPSEMLRISRNGMPES